MALLFLYQELLEVNLLWVSEVTRAKKPARLPTVLTSEEARALLKRADRLVAGALRSRARGI